MDQQVLWHDDIYGALKTDCQAIAAQCGNIKGWPKEVGHMLWPHKSPDDAGKYLSNCLDSNRNEKLDPEQVLTLINWAREAGSYNAIQHTCDQTLFTHPSPITPEDEGAKLQKEFIQAAKSLEKIMQRAERVGLSLREVG